MVKGVDDRVWVDIGHLLVRERDLGVLLQGVGQRLLRIGGIDRVRVSQSQQRILVTATEAGSGQVPPLFWEKFCLEGNRPLLQSPLDVAGDDRFGEWQTAAVVPLHSDGSVWGCLAVYSRTLQAFSPALFEALKTLALDLEAAIHTRLLDVRREENEQFLSDLANLVPGLFYKIRYRPDLGKDLEFLYVSPGIDLLLPLSPSEVMARPRTVLNALHPADRRRFFRAGIRSRDFLTVFNLEFRLRRPNGSIVWVLATAFPQRLDDGVVWTGLAIDVSPQNKLQEALQREQELLAVVIDQIGDGVVAINAEGRLALVNRTAALLLGAASSVPLRGPWQDLDPQLPWEARDQFVPWYRARADGTVLHLEAHSSDLTDAAGRRRGQVLVLRDMTDRDRIEERLRQSEKLESVGLLAGGIAHDFNNLLTGVFGFIQLARMNTDQPDKVLSYLDHAAVPFERARTLTQQLLTFARGGQIAKAVVRLPELISGILLFTLGGSKVAVEEAHASDPWPVLVNEAQIHQVFENLFINARQALEAGGHLRVQLANLAEPGPVDRGLPAGDYVQVTVEDDGPGIPSEILPKIFDPFFTTKTGGTGLGLSLCFSIIKKHGGLIEAENRTGGGARFRFFLPAYRVSELGATSG